MVGHIFIYLKNLPIVTNDGYEIEVKDPERNGTLVLQKYPKTVKHVTWPKGYPVEGEPIILRDYQADVVNRFLNNPQCLQEIAQVLVKHL